MNCLYELKRGSEKMNDVQTLKSRMFQVDVSSEGSTGSVQPRLTVNQSHIDQIQTSLFRQYAMQILRFQLNMHLKMEAIKNDSSQTKERQYYASTHIRRAFKKLMCVKFLEGESITTVDVGSILRISHKAASDIIRDALGFETIEMLKPDGTNRKRYMARSWWVRTFFNNGAKWWFEHSEELVRTRLLYNEFTRANNLDRIGDGSDL